MGVRACPRTDFLETKHDDRGSGEGVDRTEGLWSALALFYTMEMRFLTPREPVLFENS
jgi:hypothetical protein